MEIRFRDAGAERIRTGLLVIPVREKKLDEPEIGYWHQIEAGYIGRQPITPDQRMAFRATPS